MATPQETTVDSEAITAPPPPRPFGVAEGMAVVGVGLVGAGTWIIYPPAALILVGLLLIGFGLVVAARSIKV